MTNKKRSQLSDAPDPRAEWASRMPEIAQRMARRIKEVRSWGVDESKVNYDYEPGEYWLQVHLYDALTAAESALAAERQRRAQVEQRASKLEDAAFHFQTCRTCRKSGEDSCPSGLQFAAFLRGEDSDGD